MSQIHRRFTDEQVKVLLQGHCMGKLTRTDLQELLGIGRSRFFALLRAYRQDPERLTIAYRWSTPAKLTAEVGRQIETALPPEKAIAEDPDLPVLSYNYAAMRDRLRVKGIRVSTTTMIDRAGKLDCHKPRRRRRVHDRQVLTASIGAPIQHNASTHLWCPLAQDK